MRPITTRSIVLVLCAGGLLAAPVAAQECGHGGEGSEPQATLAWASVPAPTSEARGRTAALTVRNTGDVAADMLVSVLVDFGGPRAKTRRYKLRNVPPGTHENVIVDIERLRPPADMAFAGQLLASAEVRPAGACANRACQPLRRNPDGEGHDEEGAVDPERDHPAGPSFAVAAPIYFHRSATPGLFEIYGEAVLDSHYGSGDLSGRLAAVRTAWPDSDVVFARTSDAGKGLSANRKRLAEQTIAAADAESAAPPQPTDPAPKNGYRLCIRWEIQVTEQGRKITLPNKTQITEDYWHGYPTVTGTGVIAAGVPNNDGKMIVTARGPRVLVAKDGWSLETFADPATGCFSFVPPVEGPFSLFVAGEHRDNKGNTTIVRSEAGLKVIWLTSVNPQKGKTRLVPVGNYSADATLAALAGFGMYRSSMGVTGKTIDLRGVSTCGAAGGNNSSAHHRFDGLAQGVAYVRLSSGSGQASDGSGPCTTADHRRAKFIVMHEMGHAWMLLRTKTNEPNVALDLDDDFESICGFGGTAYTPDSLEFAAVGAREGLAHFYAAAVWNDTSSANGVFSMWGVGRDIRRFSDKSGGQLWNRCTTPVKCGKTVIMDWARFWWTAHTPFGSNRLSQSQVGAIYEKAILNGGLSADNYYEKFETAMEQVIASQALRDHFKLRAHWQGIRTSPSGPHCVAPYTYPQCHINPPALGAGSVGCPCTDVLPLNHNNADLADVDGYHGDGQGSYAETGSAQYCLGTNVVCGLERIVPSSIFAPICQTCGVDTMIGCSCTNDDQCNNGLDDELLACHGAPANGWAGSAPGKCLPAANTPQGRQRLVEMPWFCLDNCGSKGSNYTCLYDQLAPAIENDHARCVESVACTPPAGYCEAQGAKMCDVEATCFGDWQDCCVSECSTTTECTDMLGFPHFYECSAGSCVPPECNGSFSSYCNLYR